MNNMSFKNNKPKQIESFNEMANNYCFWEDRADTLLKSANILRREREREIRSHKGLSGYRCPPEYFTEEVEWMLKAFAIECLLKGLFVKSGHKIAENGKCIKVGKNHDLENLAKHVVGENNIPINLQEALRKLSSVAILGRYPTAMDCQLLKFSNEKNHCAYDDSVVLITDDEQSLIDTFTSELLRKLKLTKEGG